MKNAWPAICGAVMAGALVAAASGTMQAQAHPELADAGKAWTQKKHPGAIPISPAPGRATTCAACLANVPPTLERGAT